MNAEEERLAYLDRVRERLRLFQDPPAPARVKVEPVPEPAPEPIPPKVEPPIEATDDGDPLASMGRRLRRRDALALAIIARKLAAIGEAADARTLAAVARNIAKVTGARLAHSLAEQLLTEVQP